MSHSMQRSGRHYDAGDLNPKLIQVKMEFQEDKVPPENLAEKTSNCPDHVETQEYKVVHKNGGSTDDDSQASLPRRFYINDPANFNVVDAHCSESVKDGVGINIVTSEERYHSANDAYDGEGRSAGVVDSDVGLTNTESDRDVENIEGDLCIISRGDGFDSAKGDWDVGGDIGGVVAAFGNSKKRVHDVNDSTPGGSSSSAEAVEGDADLDYDSNDTFGDNSDDAEPTVSSPLLRAVPASTQDGLESIHLLSTHDKSVKTAEESADPVTSSSLPQESDNGSSSPSDEHSSQEDEQHSEGTLSSADLLCFGWQVARGMVCLCLRFYNFCVDSLC